MILTPGQRLTLGTRDVYTVIGTAWETPRHVFYRASKVFWNLHFPERTLVEAAEDESLHVLVRCPVVHVEPARLRADLQFELENVLRMPEACWFPEPLDVPDASDGLVAVPLLVLAEPHGVRLSDGARNNQPDRVIRFSRELLMMLDLLHRRGLARGMMDAADFVLDGFGRWFDLGTDQIRSAPSEESVRADLVHWARFCQEITPGGDPETDEHRWLADRVRRGLGLDPADRPTSAADLLGRPTRSEGPPASSREAIGPRLRRLWGGRSGS